VGEYRSATAFKESTGRTNIFSVTLIWSLLERDRTRKNKEEELDIR